MTPWVTGCTAIIVAALAFGCPAVAENRIALVVGNSSYQSLPPLKTPANDAKALADLLTAANFQVFWGADIAQTDMRRAIRDFSAAAAAKGADTVALLFFAGYGIQVDGENFLIPVDARIEREADVAVEAVRLADVVNALAATPSKARIVILDASRSNPFTQFKRTNGRGLALIGAPAASLVAYSAAPGAEAPEAKGANSPFVAALSAAAKTPGLSFEDALKLVRVVVHEASDGQQVPWESSRLTIGFSLFPGTAPMRVPGPRVKPTGFWRKEIPSRAPADAFEFVLTEDVADGYEEFLRVFPQPPFAPHVRSLLDRRREMVAWQNAVTLNSVASYEGFLADYARSDLAPTARHLSDRARARLATVGLPAAPAMVVAPPATTATADPGAVKTSTQPAPSKEAAKPKRKQTRAEVRRAKRAVATAKQETPAQPQPVRPPFSLSIGGVGLNLGGPR
jgi:hypothetical protein